MTLVSGTANDDIVSPPSSMAKTSRASAMNTPTGMAKITMTQNRCEHTFQPGRYLLHHICAESTSRMICAASEGVLPTRMPAASSAACLS